MQHRLPTLLAALLLAVAGTAQTTWTGAISTDWLNAGNWTAGVPDQNLAAIIAPAANQPLVASLAACRHLTVQANTALTVTGSTLEIYGDASFAATVLGNGVMKLLPAPNNPSPPPAQVTCGSQASLPTVNLDAGHSATFTDLYVRGALNAASIGFPAPTVTLHGTTRLGSGSFLFSPQGQVLCDPTGSLEVVGTLSLYWSMSLPGTVSIGNLDMYPTSSVTPASGVVNIPPGRSLRITSSAFGTTTLDVNVPAGASFVFEDGQPSGTNHFGVTNSAGSTSFYVADTTEVRCAHIDGTMNFAGDVLLVPPASATGPVVVNPGALLTVSAYYPGVPNTLHTRGTLQVDGTLGIGYGFDATLRLEDNSPTDPGRLLVSSTGTLRMGSATITGNRGIISGTGNHRASVAVHGRIEANSYLFDGLDANGLVLAASSTIGAAPMDLRNGWFDNGDPSPGSTLLTVARTAPTRLLQPWFLATNSAATHAIKAVTPFAMDVRGAFGALGSEAFEEDPFAVISWTDGVSFRGIGTPGCLGLAETRTNSAPHLGNAAFAIRCRNALPGSVAIQIVGTAGLPTPVSLLAVDLWIDPIAPFVLHAVNVDATGYTTLPLPIPNNQQLLGLSLWSQAMPFELPGCKPFGLSASTAVRIDVIQ